MVKTEVTSRELAKLLGLTSSQIRDLGKRRLIVSGGKPGTYKLQESIRNYVKHLRKPAGRGSDDTIDDTIKEPTIERKEAAAARVDLAKTPGGGMRSAMVRTSDLGKREMTKLRSLSNRILGVGGPLPPHAHVRSFRILNSFWTRKGTLAALAASLR